VLESVLATPTKGSVFILCIDVLFRIILLFYLLSAQ
jgi:hypothetical protein